MMKKVGQHALLSYEDEVDLARQYHTGKYFLQEREKLERDLKREVSDLELANVLGKSVREVYEAKIRGDEAKAALISANMRLVFHIARFYKNRGVSYSDLIQEGTVGLMKSVEKFDPARGFRFSTYASWWVKQAVSRAIAEQSRIVRIPVHIHDLLCSLHKAEKLFVEEHDRKPTISELAESLSLSVEKIELLQKCSREVKSMDDSLITGAGPKTQRELFLGDRLSSENLPVMETDSEESREKLKYLVDRKLSGREAIVVDMRYGLSDGIPMTLEQVGRKLEVTRERIRQIEAKAIEKLQQNDLLGDMKEIFQDSNVKSPSESQSEAALNGADNDAYDSTIKRNRKREMSSRDFFAL